MAKRKKERQRPLANMSQAARLSVQALGRMLKILDKLDKAQAIDRMLKMLTKIEKSVDSLDRLMELLKNIELISSAFGGRVDGVRDRKKSKKKTKKKAKKPKTIQ